MAYGNQYDLWLYYENLYVCFDIWKDFFLNLKWTGIDAYNQMKCISVKKIDSKNNNNKNKLLINEKIIKNLFVSLLYFMTGRVWLQIRSHKLLYFNLLIQCK